MNRLIATDREQSNKTLWTKREQTDEPVEKALQLHKITKMGEKIPTNRQQEIPETKGPMT